MASGSGPETRRIPRYVADILAYHGVAVLVTDKRGTGGATGTWNGLSHAEWAGDVEAELDFLRRQPDIDAGRLGLYGNSESGYVVPVVAGRRPDVRLLVYRVCAALPHAEVILDTETGMRRRRGLAEAGVARCGAARAAAELAPWRQLAMRPPPARRRAPADAQQHPRTHPTGTQGGHEGGHEGIAPGRRRSLG